MQPDIVFKNCNLVRHDGIFKAGLSIHDGKIAAIEDDERLPDAETVIDGQGKYIIPGVVDAHVHLQYPPGIDPESNIRAETRACAAGGVTTLIHLLAPADDIRAQAEDFVRLYEKNAYVDMALSARIYTRDNIRQIREINDYGIAGVKLLLPYKGSEAVWKGRVGGIDDGIVYLTFQEVARLAGQGRNVFVRVHCENVEIFLAIKDEFIEKGLNPASWNEVRPRVCEQESMQKCLYLAGITGCPLYIVHMTVKEGLPLLSQARADGVNVMVETCIQYLTQNTENVDPVLSKVNPPIREPQDNEALWEALQRGRVEIVGTDHAPVPKSMKTGIWEGTPGIPGVETFLPLMLSEGVNQKRISLEKLVEVCCYNPARKFGLTPKKGVLDVGAEADLVMIDLEKEAVAPENPVFSNSDFSTVAGKILKGWPVLTMLRGKIIAENGKVVGSGGLGRYVPARQ